MARRPNAFSFALSCCNAAQLLTTEGTVGDLEATRTAIGGAHHPRLRASPPFEPNVVSACLSRVVEARATGREPARDLSLAREAGLAARMVRFCVHAV